MLERVATEAEKIAFEKATAAYLKSIAPPDSIIHQGKEWVGVARANGRLILPEVVTNGS